MDISFNQPYFDEEETRLVIESLRSGNHSGNKSFSKLVKSKVKKRYPKSHVFLTPSCSAALEMGVMLSGIQPGDEVIMPSYTFSSTANAVLVFGGVPVFCEISSETMNLDPSAIESLITNKTKMIIPIDYAGVPSEMEEISRIASKHNLIIMLDAAQSYGSIYRGAPTGLNADWVCFSFHETKNLSCGEGGALLVNRREWVEKAFLIQEKGTDRKKMLEGLQDRYSWVSTGSSYILADILAAILSAQMNKEKEIISKRKLVFESYKNLFDIELKSFKFSTIQIDEYLEVNYHSFWFLMNSNSERQLFMKLMSERGVPAYIGYVPLHSSKMGRSLGNSKDSLPITNDLASRIVRMPIYAGMTKPQLDFILKVTKEIIVNNF